MLARSADATTDEALMLRYRDGDDGAFRALYGRYRSPLMRFSRHLAGHAGEAEEIFQETWIAVIHTRARYSVRARFATWLFAIAHRRAADRHRLRGRRSHAYRRGIRVAERHSRRCAWNPGSPRNSPWPRHASAH